MKFSAAVLALATAVAAVDTSSIPSCALPCIKKAESSAGCGEGDYSCSCSKLSQIQAPAASCILEQNACNSSELPNIVSAVEAICAAISSGSGSGSSTAAPSSKASSPPTNVSSAASFASSASSAVSVVSTAASSVSSASSAVSVVSTAASTTAAVATGTGASTIIPVASGTGASSTGGGVAVPSSSSPVVANGAERVGAAGMAVAAAVVLAL